MAGIFSASGENAMVLSPSPEVEPSAAWVSPEPQAASRARLPAVRPTRAARLRLEGVFMRCLLISRRPVAALG